MRFRCCGGAWERVIPEHDRTRLLQADAVLIDGLRGHRSNGYGVQRALWQGRFCSSRVHVDLCLV